MSLQKYVVFCMLLVLSVAGLSAQRPITLLVDSQAGEAVTTCPSDADGVIYNTLQAALACATSGMTIVVQPGTYSEALTINEDVMIQGAGANNTVITVDSPGRPITIGEGVTTSLIDLTLTGGQADQGGGLFANNATVTLERVIVTGNTASQGGAIALNTGALTIIDSTLSGNTATGQSGAGIYIHDATLTLTGTILTGNLLTGPCEGLRGAGVYIQTGSGSITDSTFNGNSASTPDCTVEGSGIYVASGAMTMTTSVMSDSVVQADPTASETVVDATLPTQGVIATSAQTQPTLVSLDANEAQIAVRWMNQLLVAVQAEKFSPPAASRVYACAGVTLYEALVPGLDGYRSLSGQIHGLAVLPQPETGLTYDYPLIANTAMAALTEGLFPAASETTRQGFVSLRQTIELERGESVPMNVFARSVELGARIGAAMLEWAHSDNYPVIKEMTYSLPVDQPHFWQPLDGQKPLEPYWGMLRPSVLPIASMCDIEPSVLFNSEAGSSFYEQENEVYTAGLTLTDEQRNIALFWSDGSSETATPPGHWISIVNQVVTQQKLSLGEAAQAYALTSVAMSDAFIATWAVKYRLQYIRPITYINRYIDPNWTPLLKTPPFPDYPSGHSVSSGAASTVLTGLLGDVAFTDATHEVRQLPARSFTSFTQAAQEAAMSRLYGGIHYREAIENGLQQGNCIGEMILKTLKTKS